MDEDKKIENKPAVEDNSLETKEVEEVKEEEREEEKVPFQRFKKYVWEAKEAQREVEALRRRIAEYENSSNSRQDRPYFAENSEEVPQYFQDLYGNVNDPVMGPQVKKAWEAEQKRILDLDRRAEEAADRVLSRRQQEENARYEANLQYIENEQEAFEEYLGRKLTQKEEDGVMAVLSEYSPQDENGIDSLLPFDKAFEIYQLQNGKSKETQKKIAGISSSSSGAGSADLQGGNPNFNKTDFGNWRKDPRLQEL